MNRRTFFSNFWYEARNYLWIHWIVTKVHPLELYNEKENYYFIRGKLCNNFKMDIDVHPNETLEWEYEIRNKIIYITNVYNK